MTKYTSWSIDALKGYLVMTESLANSTNSESLKEKYERDVTDIKNEIDERVKNNPEIFNNRNPAFPEEMHSTGSIGQS